eukprot:gb/GECH01001608.1/.p1 GENE.gb/GECH01001608.1/~~gb/GECH01001608.1/.p1  ORF type:complete len:222 (+),score=46.49 gb/GECH01001608.1/:1-666(+)
MLKALKGDGKRATIKKAKRKGSGRFDLHTDSVKSLGSNTNLEDAVKLPEGVELNDWLANHVVDFYESVSMLYSGVEQDCTAVSCPSMTVGTQFEYLWVDGHDYKKPTAVPAPEYIDRCLDWIENLISDESVFVVEENAKYPKNFKSQVKKIMKRMFRIYAHVLYEHFRKVKAEGYEAHINTSFKHFMHFNFEFDLMDRKEMVPMKKWIENNLGGKYSSQLE